MKYDDEMHYVLFSANDMGMILVTIYSYGYTHLYERSVWFKFNLDDYLIACKLIFYMQLNMHAPIWNAWFDLRLTNTSSDISHGASKIFIVLDFKFMRIFYKFGFTCISANIM